MEKVKNQGLNIFFSRHKICVKVSISDLSNFVFKGVSSIVCGFILALAAMVLLIQVKHVNTFQDFFPLGIKTKSKLERTKITPGHFYIAIAKYIPVLALTGASEINPSRTTPKQ